MTDTSQFLAASNTGDSYYTPPWCYENLPIDWSNYKTAMEPSMGDGRLFLFLEEQGLLVDGRDPIWQGEGLCNTEDFFEWDGYVDLIIGNPPFSKAQAFIEYSLPRCKTLIFLLRLNFLGSKKRMKFWQANTPDKLFVCSKRPSFNGRGTDSCDYGWYVWQNENKFIDSGFEWMDNN